ncbi:hypothetical protein SME24J_08830 [Serratia marcescens]|jgi:hypothetical protein|nr:hypothetical protein SME24J_08830 [Serratia marcescens]BEM91440.1 hypothetical protein SME53J_08790 [Serratia marcescens]
MTGSVKERNEIIVMSIKGSTSNGKAMVNKMICLNFE